MYVYTQRKRENCPFSHSCHFMLAITIAIIEGMSNSIEQLSDRVEYAYNHKPCPN